MTYDWNRVAMFGSARSGKDTAIAPLIQLGFKKHAFGDLIKRDLAELFQRRLGLDVFTDVTADKAKFRRSLEYVGDDLYDSYLEEFIATLPRLCANPRIMRVREARAWRELGHPIIEVTRKGLEACSEFERLTMQEMHDAGVITHTITNDGSEEDLQEQLLELVMGADVEEGCDIATSGESLPTIVYKENGWRGY